MVQYSDLNPEVDDAQDVTSERPTGASRSTSTRTSPTGSQVDRAEELREKREARRDRKRDRGGRADYSNASRSNRGEMGGSSSPSADSGYRSSPTGPGVDRVEEEGIQGDDAGVEAGTGPAAEQGRELESEALQQSDQLDRRDQIRVEKQGDALRAIPTQEGQRAIEQSAKQALASDLSRLGIDASMRDVEITNGRARVSEDANVEGYDVVGPARNSTEATQRRRRGVSTGTYLTRDPPDTRSFPDRVASDFQEEHPTLERGEDFTVETERTEEGQRTGRVELTGEGKREVARRQEDVFSGATAAIERSLSEVAQLSSGSEETRVEFDVGSREGSIANVAAVEARQSTGEQFGDYAIRVPENDLVQETIATSASMVPGLQGTRSAIRQGLEATEGQRVEPILGAASEGYTQYVAQPGGQAIGGAMATADEAIEGPYEDEAEEAVREATGFDTSPEGSREIGEGVGTGALQLFNVPSYALTAKEGAELTGYGVKETVSGRGGQFLGDLGGATVLASAEAANYAKENPERLTGQVAGGLVGSAGAIGAARAIGGAGAARVTSTVIQPGEELAIGAARRGLISSRSATMVPGVREGHIGTGRDVDRTWSAGQIRERFPDIGGRAPSVRFEADPEAGRIEISDDLRQRAWRETVGRVQRGVGTTRELPARTRQALGDANVARTAGRGVGRLEARAGQGLRRVTASDIGDLAYRAGRYEGRTEYRARQELTKREVQAEDAAGRAREAIRDRRPRRSDLSETVRSAREEIERVGQSVAHQSPTVSGDVALQQAFTRGSDFPSTELLPAGRRAVSEGVRRAEGGVRAFEERGADVATRVPSRTGDIALQQSYLRDSEMPSPSLSREASRISGMAQETMAETERRVGEFGRRVAVQSPSPMGDAALQQAFTRGGEVPMPSRPDVELPDLVGAAQREATAMRFGLSERMDEAGRSISNLRDFTIRIGEPDRSTILDPGFDEPPIRSQMDDPFGLRDDTEGDLEGGMEPGRQTGGDRPGRELERGGQETGVAVQQVFRRPEAEGRAGRRETDPAQPRDFGLETGFESAFTTPTPSFETQEVLGQGMGMDAVSSDLSRLQGHRTELRGEGRTEPGSETGQESGVYGRTEIRQEQRGEVRSEVAPEVRHESGMEADWRPEQNNTFHTIDEPDPERWAKSWVNPVVTDVQQVFGMFANPMGGGREAGPVSHQEAGRDRRSSEATAEDKRIPNDGELPDDWKSEVPDDPDTYVRFYREGSERSRGRRANPGFGGFPGPAGSAVRRDLENLFW